MSQSPGFNDTNAEQLWLLMQAMDELVEELHVKPQKWAEMATDGGRTAPCAGRDTPTRAEAAIRFAIRTIRYSRSIATLPDP